MLKAGIIGCGSIAQVHAAVLSQTPGVRLAVCADVIPSRALEISGKYGCQAYPSLEDMLKGEALDAVHVCTPHHLHTPMALELAQRGVAVFLEKPPAIDRAQWEALQAAAEGVPMGVCFQNRYNPNVREAERLIASGGYGGLLGARAFVTWKRGESYYAGSSWRGRWASEGGGALINQAIHTLDLMVRFMGGPDQAECHMTNRHLPGVIQVEDTVEAYLVLGGKPALLYASNAYTQDAPVMLEFHLEKAVLRIEDESLEIREGGKVSRQGFPMPESLGRSYWGNGHKACIGDFYDSLVSKKPFQNDLASVRGTMEAVLRMYEQNRPS